MILPRDFYARETMLVARELLGMQLVTHTPEGKVVGKIVETEAYLANDPASHSFRGKSVRNAAMFDQPGTVYVYLIYGINQCLNIATNQTGVGEAVLIRAVEPIIGIEIMTQRRGMNDAKRLCNGPGKLTQAFGISLEDNFEDVTTSSRIYIEGEPGAAKLQAVPAKIVQTTRVGITKAADLKGRFYLKDSPYISRR